MCISLAQKAKALVRTTGRGAEEMRRELWGDARAAMHFSAVASRHHGLEDCSRRDLPSSGHCGRPAIYHLAWALDFLDYHYEARDEMAVADTFFMLSQARDIALWAKSPKFVEAIVFAMQPDKSTRVRHAALHTAWEIRVALGTPDDAIRPLLPKFVAALLSAVLTNMRSANQTENDRSPDRFIYHERDLRYLQILYTFARNKDGALDELLRSEGHRQRCLDMAVQDATWSTLSGYLIALAEIFRSRGAEGRFLDDFDSALRASHLILAWETLEHRLPKCDVCDVLQLEEVEETLPSLIAFTRRLPALDPSSQGYMSDIQSALGMLQQWRPHSAMTGEMEDLVKWLEAR
ncbi:hypothetical protein BV22DRAFT_854989 [Leucogyrophana mollusca]|uniref:Uncharacterized protein n=1 Tax=Leucogyrophana mollusca TaxID=85980 RepID=A0ACB8B485_9AGAM|nr:hypothetical protein BV22DRAFT_854989 [Leucogyrophana mollusca]